MQHHGVYNLEYRYRCKGAKSLLTKLSTLGLLHSFQFRRYRHPLAFRLRRLFYLFPPGVKHHRFYNCSYIYRLAILRRAVPALLQIARLVAACSPRRRHFLLNCFKGRASVPLTPTRLRRVGVSVYTYRKCVFCS